MKKKKEKSPPQLHFKRDEQGQSWVFPPHLGEMIPLDHPARFINQFVDELDVTDILMTYKSGGTSCYHPRVLIKILLYGYLNREYSSRVLERQCRENVVYMWLCGMLQPDHVTINNFRSQKLKDGIKAIFGGVVEKLYESGYIDLKTQIVDGTKIESVANKYSYVWEKNVLRYSGNLKQKIEKILEDIDTYVSEDEDSTDVSEHVSEKEEQKALEELSASDIEKKLERYTDQTAPVIKKKMNEITSKHLPKLKKYETQRAILNGRSSYSKTDPDASFMRMKDDVLGNGQLKPAYNIQLSSEDQYIINYTIHQNANDGSCYKAHTEDTIALLQSRGLPKFEQAMGDSIYGTEENYEYLACEQIENYLKYPSFHAEQKRKNQNNPFRIENFYYNGTEDYFVCPMGQHLTCSSERHRVRKSGYVSTHRVYEAQNCTGCPLQGLCTKGQSNRMIHRNANLEGYKKKARENLCSAQGIQLRQKRNVDVEPIFGHLKYNRGFNRFTLRGIEKIKVEFGLLAIAHNLKKMIKRSLLEGKNDYSFIYNETERLIKYGDCLIRIIQNRLNSNLRFMTSWFKHLLSISV
ncbi:MAG TPA: IS1182 family transposase [Saprospiraceae bacterium]|nr:IS1182 family transposase [Saprospiraceae bacterium]